MCSSMELLPHHVVELILRRLPVKPLSRFKSVSKTWKSTIESQRFQHEQLIRRMQSQDPDVLFVPFEDFDYPRTRVELGSSTVTTINKIPLSYYSQGHGTCDGLICLHSSTEPIIVMNPVTKWQLHVPKCNSQQFISPLLGFGKDKFAGTYKLVDLYNSDERGLDNVTTCEVFDFSTNAWRYVVPASPYRILPGYHNPVYLDGSLYWLTEEETNVLILCFDLHKETFQVITKAPFDHLPNPKKINMCILDNRLCVSELSWLQQVIWSFDSGTWKKLCSLDFTKSMSWFGDPCDPALPIAILEKKKLLLQGCGVADPLVIHDLHTKSYDLVYQPTSHGDFLYYFESLISISCYWTSMESLVSVLSN